MATLGGTCSTGIAGFDNILGGGLPRNAVYLVEGHPGVGKTTLAMQFLLEGVRCGERSLYAALAETKKELEMVAQSHGWDLSGIDIIELAAVQRVLGKTAQSSLFQSGEMELTELGKMVLEEAEARRPHRLVVDSMSELRLLAQSPVRFRRQILNYKQKLADIESTVLLLDDRSAGENADAHIQSIVHGVFTLTAAPLRYGIFRRQVSIGKLRGVRFREGNHDYSILKGGLTVYPRLVAAEHFGDFNPHATAGSGNPHLDALVGGGLHYGTSNLLIGPAGSGKSTVASMYAHAGAAAGQRVLYYQFDETTGTIRARSREMGLDLDPYIEAGRLTLRQIDPAVISPGELAYGIRELVEKESVRIVIFDSLNGYANAMPHEEFLQLHLHELLMYLNQQGVLTIMIVAQQGLVGPMGTPIDVSYLADSVIVFRYFEAMGRIRKAISVIKKRSGQHETTVRELDLTPAGIKVGEPLVNFQGVLTGVPRALGVETASTNGH